MPAEVLCVGVQGWGIESTAPAASTIMRLAGWPRSGLVLAVGQAAAACADSSGSSMRCPRALAAPAQTQYCTPPGGSRADLKPKP